jgi:hypothetical protein
LVFARPIGRARPFKNGTCFALWRRGLGASIGERTEVTFDARRREEIQVRNQTDSLVYATERRLAETGSSRPGG